MALRTDFYRWREHMIERDGNDKHIRVLAELKEGGIGGKTVLKESWENEKLRTPQDEEVC